MKKGEKIFFVVSVILVVLALASVSVRSMNKKGPSSKDYYVWSEAGKKGYVFYKKQGCNSCHRALRMGEAGVAPVLDGVGTRRTEKWLHAYFKNPEDMTPGTAHTGRLGPDFRKLSDKNKILLVAFLKGLKSNPGSSNYPVPPFTLDAL